MSISFRFAGAVALAVMLAAPSPSYAQKLLRYKFNPGQTHRYAITQKMVQSVATPERTVKITLTQTMDTRQKTDAVDTEGVASVTQTVERVRMDMDLPQGRTVHYDSAAKEAPEGIAKAYATAVGGMVNQPIQMKLTPRGETRKIELPPEALAQLKKAAGAAADIAAPENLTQLTNLAIFPEEPVSVGDTWNHQATITNPAFGKLLIQTTYRYQGEEIRQGRKLDKISSSMTLKFADKGALAAMNIKAQEGQGTIFFDPALGQIVESASTTRIKMAASVAGMTLDQDMEISTDVKLQPAEAPPSAKP